MYALHQACKAGNLPLVKKLLSQGHDINELDKLGMSPISRAAEAGHLSVVQYLITQTANLSARSAADWSPNLLYRTCRCEAFQRLKILRWLLRNFHALSFTDGTQKYHVELALQLLANPDNKQLTNLQYHDRLSHWIRATFFMSYGYARLTEAADDSKKYLQLALKYFLLLPNKSDFELRGYQTCLQYLILFSQTHAPLDKEYVIDLAHNILTAGKQIKNKKEQDVLMLALNYYNLGATYKISYQFQKAREFYLRSFKFFPLVSADKLDSLSRVPEIFQDLSECYPGNIHALIFFNLIKKCFATQDDINDKLLNTFDLIRTKDEKDVYALLEPAIVIIENLLHFCELDILPNKQLSTFLLNEENKEKFLDIRDALQAKQDLILLAQIDYAYRSPAFFANPPLKIDTMENNLPPLSLAKGYPG